MGNFSGGFHFLISTIFDILAFIVMLRFIMQYTRASFNNPVGDLVVKATNPALMPLRKVVPGFKGHDLAAIVLVFIILLVKYLLLTVIGGTSGAAVLPLALLGILKTAIDVFLICIIVRVILSWVTPGGHALSGLLSTITSPILDPIQRVIPPFNGLDLSPLVAILILYFIKIVLGLG